MAKATKRIIIGFVCFSTIIITVLTQVPALDAFFRPAMYVLWILAVFAGLCINKITVPWNNFFLIYIFTLVILVLECLICYAARGTHLNSFILRVVPLPLICYLTGLLFANVMDDKMIHHGLLIFFTTVLIAFSYIFLTYIGSFSVWFNADYYIYQQKNSAAQIIGSTIILSSFLLKPRQKWLQIIKYTALTFMFLIVVAMQCRTALAGLLFTASVYSLFLLKGYRKILVTIFFGIFILMLLNSNALMRYITKAFVFSERQTKSLNDFTSGRLTLFADAWNLFKKNIFIGTGHHRVDNLYLCLLGDVGLIGSIPVICLWGIRIFKNIAAYRKEKTPFTACIICFTAFYFCESLFEAFPPFGPGVCSFMFWIACAFLDEKGK